MHSHHSHSGQYCTHATGDLEDCIKEAIRQKFTLFCLTEHIPRYREDDLYPGEEVNLIDLIDMFCGFHKHARELQAKYRSQIDILVGLETEYIRAIDLRVLELLVAAYPVDFVVGSVHHVNGIPIDFDRETWDRALISCHSNEEEFYGRYFDHQYEVFQTFHPMVIGHFDVILLFAPSGQETNLLQWDSVKSKILRNIEFVISYGGLFELNSAAFRKGWSTAYPASNLVDLITSMGGHFCLSDDSHGPHQVGLNFHRLQDYVRAQKLTQLGRLTTQGVTQTENGVRHKVAVEKTDDILETFLKWEPRPST